MRLCADEQHPAVDQEGRNAVDARRDGGRSRRVDDATEVPFGERILDSGRRDTNFGGELANHVDVADLRGFLPIGDHHAVVIGGPKPLNPGLFANFKRQTRIGDGLGRRVVAEAIRREEFTQPILERVAKARTERRPRNSLPRVLGMQLVREPIDLGTKLVLKPRRAFDRDVAVRSDEVAEDCDVSAVCHACRVPAVTASALLVDLFDELGESNRRSAHGAHRFHVVHALRTDQSDRAELAVRDAVVCRDERE